MGGQERHLTRSADVCQDAGVHDLPEHPCTPPSDVIENQRRHLTQKYCLVCTALCQAQPYCLSYLTGCSHAAEVQNPFETFLYCLLYCYRSTRAT